MGLNAKLGHPYRGSGHGRERGEYRAVVKGQARKARRAEDAKATEAEFERTRCQVTPVVAPCPASLTGIAADRADRSPWRPPPWLACG